MYPTGILLNVATQRYHPILFRMAPMPGGADDALAAQRFKSMGHHTDGFDDIDSAKAHISSKRQDGMIDTGLLWEWDGVEVPAMVKFFSLSDLAANDRP